MTEFIKFTGNSKFNPQPKPEKQEKKKPKAIRKNSVKRTKENKEYLVLRDVFLNGKRCAVFPEKRATQVHHKKGRIGKLLCDVRFFLPVSAEGHKKIEENPEWAKEKGYSLNRL